MTSGSSESTANSTQGDRVTEIEKLFLKDGDKYRCKVEKCQALVKCQEKRGAPGRLQHLRHMHAELFASLPGKKKRPKRERIANVDGNDDADIILWLARRAHPFSELDDPWIKTKTTLTRKNVVERALGVAQKMLEDVFAELRGKTVSISLDGGTNAGVKTVDFCVVHEGVSHFVKAARCGATSAEITTEINNIKKQFSEKLITINAGIGDNAANIQRAIGDSDLIVASCACHTVQLFVKEFLLSTFEIKEILDSCRICDEDEAPTVPLEIESRWNATYLALDVIVIDWCKFVALNAITREQAATAKAAHARLRPFYFLTLGAEVENHNCFYALKCFISFLEFKDLGGFREKWRRNVSKPWVTCAISVLPQLKPDSLNPWHRNILKKMILAFINPTAEAKERVEEEISLLFEGGAQRLWRMSGKTVEGYWEKLQLQFIAAMAEVLSCIPASSADVERRFSDHAKIHHQGRKVLKDESVNVMLQIRAGQKCSTAKRGWATVCFDAFTSENLEALLMLEVSLRIEREAAKLKVADKVIVHFVINNSAVTRQKKKAYNCTLKKKIDANWQVDWEDHSKELFVPLVDEWELA